MCFSNGFPFSFCIIDHESQTLKEHLIDELDYVLVPTEAWNKLVSWYGCLEGQKPIIRKVPHLLDIVYFFVVLHIVVISWFTFFFLCLYLPMSDILE